MSIAAMPSTSAWCIFASDRVAPALEPLDERDLPQRPRAVQARATSRCRRARRAARRCPGADRRVTRTCQRMSKWSSSTQTGFVIPGRRAAGAGDSAAPGAGASRCARSAARVRSRISNTSTPPTAMFTGPCSAASEDRSAGERSSAIGPRPYPGRKMAAWRPSRVCSGPARSRCSRSRPWLRLPWRRRGGHVPVLRVLAEQRRGPARREADDRARRSSGLAFDNHPLHYADGWATRSRAPRPAERTFAAGGVYHVVLRHPRRFDGTKSRHVRRRRHDQPPAGRRLHRQRNERPLRHRGHLRCDASATPTPTQSINYTWDLDGDGADDPGQTAVKP